MDPFLIFISVTNMESIGGTFRNLFRWQQDQQQVNIMVLGMCYCCLRKLQHYWIITPYNKIRGDNFKNNFSRFFFHWILFFALWLLRSQRWFWCWLGEEHATGHYLNQWCPPPPPNTHTCTHTRTRTRTRTRTCTSPVITSQCMTLVTTVFH